MLRKGSSTHRSSRKTLANRVYGAASRFFWELRAREIERRYGRSVADAGELGQVFAVLRPRSLLEVGCGTGRLFTLYEQAGVDRVVGVDISSRALAVARRRYPAHSFVRASAANLPCSERFDLVVAFRTLQHVEPGEIGAALDGIAALTDALFLKEQRAGRGHLYLFIHDYDALLGARGFEHASLTDADADAALYVRRPSSSESSSARSDEEAAPSSS